MKTHRKIAIHSLIFTLVGLLIAWAFVWHFWITFLSLVELLNILGGIVGAVLIFPKFFKRPLNWETVGIWTAILFAGFLVLLVGATYKPKYIAY